MHTAIHLYRLAYPRLEKLAVARASGQDCEQTDKLAKSLCSDESLLCGYICSVLIWAAMRG